MQGVHCVGCVWLIEELLRRASGGEHVEVNPTLGRVDMVVGKPFDVRAFVESVERFGYLFGPALKRAPGASRDPLWRHGICAAISMSSMIFAIPLDAGPIFRLLTTLSFGLGAAAVAIGGPVSTVTVSKHMLRTQKATSYSTAGSFRGDVATRTEGDHGVGAVAVVAINTSRMKLVGKWQNPDVTELSIEALPNPRTRRIVVTGAGRKEYAALFVMLSMVHSLAAVYAEADERGRPGWIAHLRFEPPGPDIGRAARLTLTVLDDRPPRERPART